MNIKGSCIRKHRPLCTFNVIADNLADCDVLHMPPCTHRPFAWCAVPTSNALALHEKDPNILILLTPEDLGSLSAYLDVCCGILLLDEGTPFSLENPPFDPCHLESLLILQGRGERGFLSRVQSDLQALFLEFSDIAAECEMIVARGGTGQEILDVVEPLYGNWINISDATYNLVARTQNVDPPDPLSKQLVELGCHSADSVNRARKRGIFRDWREQDDIEVFEAWEVVPCGHMTAILRVEGMYYGHVVMVFNETPYTPGVEDVFRAVVGYIKTLVNKKAKRVSDGFSPHQHFMETLVTQGSDLNEAYIESQTQILDIPREGLFRLASIDYNNSDCNNQPLHLLSVIRASFSKTLSCLYDRSILVLYFADCYDPKTEKTSSDELEMFCNQYCCNAFVSGFSESISKTALLFEQIAITKRYISCLKSSSVSFGQKSRVHRFEDAFSFYCCDYGRRDELLFEFSINHTILDLIADGDHNRDVCDIKLLYYYLVSERRATPVAELLHMHRNNVIYRASSIEKRYNLDLNRPETRSSLLSYFRIKIMFSARFRNMLG